MPSAALAPASTAASSEILVQLLPDVRPTTCERPGLDPDAARRLTPGSTSPSGYPARDTTVEGCRSNDVAAYTDEDLLTVLYGSMGGRCRNPGCRLSSRC